MSETWFKEESNWTTGLEGYKVYRCDRKERIGGGVAIWVTDSIASRESGDNKEGINEESVWVEIRDCKNSKILEGCFYRAPGVKEEEEGGVHEELKRACGKGRVLIMGDFNLPGKDWVQEQGKGRVDEDFLVLVQDCFLTQFVDKPTRGSAVLDLLLSNDLNMGRRWRLGSI